MEKGQEIWHMEFLEPVQIGSLSTVSRKLVWYKLSLVGVQEFGWDKGGTVRTEDYILYIEKLNKNHQLRTGLLYTTEENQQLIQQSLLVI